MTKNLLSSGMIAGAVAGLVMALLQFWMIQPLIVEAERYETGELVLSLAIAVSDPAEEATTKPPVVSSTAHAGMEKTVRFDLSRNFQTALFLILMWSGFGLLTTAMLAATAVIKPTIQASGFAIAVIGFLAFCVAPALGLPPELPGMPAADLEARQIWWLFTVVSTAIAASVIVLSNSPLASLAALAIGLLPHLVGAPVLDQQVAAVVPPELSALFSARVIGLNLVAWVVLGLVVARLSGLTPSRATPTGLQSSRNGPQLDTSGMI